MANASTDLFACNFAGFDRAQLAAKSALLAVSLAAALLNGFVVVCAYRLAVATNDAVHVFIFSMSLADLAVTAYGAPAEFLSDLQLVVNYHWCLAYQLVNWLGLSVSALSLTCLNMEKLIYFRWPLHYDDYVSLRRAVFASLAVWLTVGAYIGFYWLTPGITNLHADCYLETISSPWYEIHTIGFCNVPIISSAALSIYLCRLTRRMRQCPTANSASSTMQKLRALVFILATTAWTTFSLLPYRIFSLVRLHSLSQLTAENVSPAFNNFICYLSWGLLYLLMLNPVVNPIITTTIYAPYRQRLQRVRRRLCCQLATGRRPSAAAEGSGNNGGVPLTDATFFELSQPLCRPPSDAASMAERTHDAAPFESSQTDAAGCAH